MVTLPSIKEYKINKLSALTIENSKLQLTMLPELGGKIISVINKKTGFNFLWENDQLERVKSDYGSDYGLYGDTGGIDECFPTIFSCKYKGFPWDRTEVPDHGEIWPLKFNTSIKNNKIIQEVPGVRFPYIFYRTIEIKHEEILLKYKLKNLSLFSFNNMWSIHPMFLLLDNTRLKHEGNPDITFGWSSREDIKLLSNKYKWPAINTEKEEIIDLSELNKDMDWALKFTLSNLKEGKITLEYLDVDEGLEIYFDRNIIKYLGLWINSGGYPVDSKNKYNCLAIEPTTGIFESLDMSIENNGCNVLDGGKEFCWSLTMKIL